jgi:hypothetical protein
MVVPVAVAATAAAAAAFRRRDAPESVPESGRPRRRVRRCHAKELLVDVAGVLLGLVASPALTEKCRGEGASTPRANKLARERATREMDERDVVNTSRQDREEFGAQSRRRNWGRSSVGLKKL